MRPRQSFAATVIGADRRGRWQARVALAEKARAEEVKEFIASVFREADPTQGEGKVLSGAELLRQAERRLNDRADVEPQIRVELLAIIGESLFGLQENTDSARVLGQALQLYESLGVPSDALGARLHLVLSQVYEIVGRHDDARRALERSFAVLTASKDDASPVFIHAKLQQAALGVVSGDYRTAELAARKAISKASTTLGPTIIGGRNRIAGFESRLHAHPTARTGGRTCAPVGTPFSSGYTRAMLRIPR